MPRVTTAAERVRRLLNVMLAGGLLAALGTVVLQLPARPGNAVAVLLLVVAAAVAWRFRMTDRHPRAASLVLALCGIGTVTFGDNLGLPLLFAALIVLVVDWGLWMGSILGVLDDLGVLVDQLHAGHRGAWTPVLLQSLANVAVLAIVLGLRCRAAGLRSGSIASWSRSTPSWPRPWTPPAIWCSRRNEPAPPPSCTTGWGTS
ncbi:MAG: hypothetical protein R2719_00960 [Micropruina sp.]